MRAGRSPRAPGNVGIPNCALGGPEEDRQSHGADALLAWEGSAGTGMSQEQAVQEPELFLQVPRLLEHQEKPGGFEFEGIVTVMERPASLTP